MTAMPEPRTLHDLKNSRWAEPQYRDRTVRDEIRANLLTRLASGDPLFPGIVGYEDTIIPQITWNDLSNAFGHGLGFTLGLIFLAPIFVLILAFGSSEYRGTTAWHSFNRAYSTRSFRSSRGAK